MLNLQDLTVSELQAYCEGMKFVADLFEQLHIKIANEFSTQLIKAQRLIDSKYEEMENFFNDARS